MNAASNRHGNYRRILLIVDHSLRRTPAFERAVALARASGAALHMTLFDRNAVIAAAEKLDRAESLAARDAWIADRRARLQEEALLLERDGLQVTCEVVWARNALEEILIHVQECGADLVVKDTQHESLIRRVLMTPLDWHLLRECAAPLLLVNSLAQVLPKRILAAVDLQPHSAAMEALNDQIIQAALSLAMQSGAALHLAYCFEVTAMAVTGPAGTGVEMAGELYVALERIASQAFAALCDRYGVPEERRHLLYGPPGVSLAELAGGDNSDVIVIGSERHTALDRAMLGTAAESILKHAPCDVLAVKRVL